MSAQASNRSRADVQADAAVAARYEAAPYADAASFPNAADSALRDGGFVVAQGAQRNRSDVHAEAAIASHNLANNPSPLLNGRGDYGVF